MRASGVVLVLLAVASCDDGGSTPLNPDARTDGPSAGSGGSGPGGTGGAGGTGGSTASDGGALLDLVSDLRPPTGMATRAAAAPRG